jgi:hypothetical protein
VERYLRLASPASQRNMSAACPAARTGDKAAIERALAETVAKYRVDKRNSACARASKLLELPKGVRGNTPNANAIHKQLCVEVTGPVGDLEAARAGPCGKSPVEFIWRLAGGPADAPQSYAAARMRISFRTRRVPLRQPIGCPGD